MQTSTAVFQMILHSVTVWLTQWYHSGKVELCSNEVELWHIIVNGTFQYCNVHLHKIVHY